MAALLGAATAGASVPVLIGGLGATSSVAVYELDLASGSLVFASASSAAGPSPAFLAWPTPQPGGANVSAIFASNHIGTGAAGATASAWDAASYELSALPAPGNFQPVDDPAHIAVDPSGKWVLTASYSQGTVAVLPIQFDASGRVTGLGAPAQVLPTAQVGAKAHQVVFDASGRFVYVPCLGSDWIQQYAFDAAAGLLSPRGTVTLPAGSGPRHLALHPTLHAAYCLNELGNTIAWLDFDPASGALSADFVAQPQRIASTLRTGIPPAPVQGAAELLISRDGLHVYASNRASGGGGDNSVVVFAVDIAGTSKYGVGSLKLSGWATGVGAGAVNFPRHMSFTPDADNTLLLVANQLGGSVSVFRRHPQSGLLDYLGVTMTNGTDAGVPAPTFVSVVPNAPPPAAGPSSGAASAGLASAAALGVGAAALGVELLARRRADREGDHA